MGSFPLLPRAFSCLLQSRAIADLWRKIKAYAPSRILLREAGLYAEDTSYREGDRRTGLYG
jgi:hypothetical protein